MNEALPQRKGRNSERLFLLLIAIVFGVLFYTLFSAHQRSFQDVDKRLQDGTMVNLNDSHPGERMHTLLQKGYYLEDKKDIDLVEVAVNKGIQPGQHAIDNIGELNKRAFFINADDAFIKGKSFLCIILVMGKCNIAER